MVFHVTLLLSLVVPPPPCLDGKFRDVTRFHSSIKCPLIEMFINDGRISRRIVIFRTRGPACTSDWRKQKLPHVRTNSHSISPIGGNIKLPHVRTNSHSARLIGGTVALLAFRLAEQQPRPK